MDSLFAHGERISVAAIVVALLIVLVILTNETLLNALVMGVLLLACIPFVLLLMATGWGGVIFLVGGSAVALTLDGLVRQWWTRRKAGQ